MPTVIVDGKVLVQHGRLTRVDEAEVYSKRGARGATRHYWGQRVRLAAGPRGVDRIIPPAFPIHGTL